MSKPHDPNDPVLTPEERESVRAQRIALGLTNLDCGIVLNMSASNYGCKERGVQKMYASHRRKLMKFFAARAEELERKRKA